MELSEGWFAGLMIIFFMGGWLVGLIQVRDVEKDAWSAGYKRGLEAGKAKNEYR